MQMYVLKRVYHGYIKLEWYFLMQGFILIDSSWAFLDCIMVTSPYFIDIFLTFFKQLWLDLCRHGNGCKVHMIFFSNFRKYSMFLNEFFNQVTLFKISNRILQVLVTL